jgi:signal peptidase I
VTGRHLADGRALLGLCTGSLCAGWLIVVATLTGWVLLPALAGWQPEVVASGSMAPALHEGDVVLADSHARSPSPGQIVVVRDPDVGGGLLTHRVLTVTGGVLRTKGDANSQADPRAATPADLVGTVRLVVPAAGWWSLIVHHPRTQEIGAPALTAAALTVAALIGVRTLPTRRLRPPPAPVPDRCATIQNHRRHRGGGSPDALRPHRTSLGAHRRRSEVTS